VKNFRVARKGRSPFDFHPHPPALPAGGANAICFRYQFAAVKRAIPGILCLVSPFYSKLMDRMKEQLAALSFAGCRKSFFDSLTAPSVNPKEPFLAFRR